MGSLGKTIIIIVCSALLLAGCTFHFKASEVDAAGEVVKNPTNDTYVLESIDLF